MHAISRLFVNFRKVEMDQISFVCLPPMNKYFLLIFAHFGLKTTCFLNTHKNYRCKVSTLKIGRMIALFMLDLKNKFSLRWENPLFWGDRWKNRAKNRKMFQIPGCLGAIFPVPPRISEPV